MSELERPLETHDIQGIILSGYIHLPFLRYIFLHLGDANGGKAWLAKLAQVVTSARYDLGQDGKPVKPAWALNVALTAPGIQALGFDTSTFSQEFQEGIAYRAEADADGIGNRSKRLGDTDADSPFQWHIGNPNTPAEDACHICLIIQTRTKEELDEKYEHYRKLWEGDGLKCVHLEEGYLPADGKEHFGFADAISEPDLVGSPKRIKDAQSCVQPGEFILGYQNEYGRLPATPTVDSRLDPHNNLKPEEHAPDPTGSPQGLRKDLGRNGSYFVFRKLHQQVATWRKYFDQQFPETERDLMQAKFIGRWHSGAPLVKYPDADPFAGDVTGQGRVNDFCYEADAAGLRCPIGAHIRRVNPRDSLEDDPAESIKSVNRHRLLRRGALFGPKLPPDALDDDGVGRGVLFFGVNTDIKRQFEFIQQTWIQRPKFNGLYDEVDPVLGNHSDDRGFNNLTIQRDPVQCRLTGLPHFVQVQGGVYFFLPSIAALHFFAGIKNSQPGT